MISRNEKRKTERKNQYKIHCRKKVVTDVLEIGWVCATRPEVN